MLHNLSEHVILLHLLWFPLWNELVLVLSWWFSIFISYQILGDLGSVLGVVLSPSSKRSEWIAFCKVVASRNEGLSSAILGQTEVVYD